MNFPRVFFPLALIAVSSGTAQNLTNDCPEFEGVPNCYCELHPNEQFLVKVICKDIADSDEFLKSIKALSGHKIDHLELVDIGISTWPSDIFNGTSVDFLHIENSSIENFGTEGGGSIFSGLETSIRYLSLLKLNLTDVDWSLVAVAKSLQAMSVVLTPLKTLPAEFSAIGDGQIFSVSLQGTNISSVHDEVFAGLRNITDIRLTSNKLTELKRSMFPNPANDLMELSLMLNEISDLPEDIFTAMPSLQNVFLDHNKLTHLPENIFSPIWKQLNTLSVNGNPLHCDCKFAWFVNKTKISVPASNDFSWVKCKSPPNLKGRELSTLKIEELECP